MVNSLEANMLNYVRSCDKETKMLRIMGEIGKSCDFIFWL